MPALLLLFHRRRAGVGLRAGADLATLPCRLQVYFNGHSWLASLLRQRKIGLIDNAFVEIADWQRAQHIANGLEIKRLHRRLDEMAHRFCPIYRDFGVAYH